MAAHGYPLTPRKGDAHHRPAAPRRPTPWSSTPAPRSTDGELTTSGGRVLCVTVLADSVKQAQQRAYEVLQRIHFDGAQYRKRHRPPRRPGAAAAWLMHRRPQAVGDYLLGLQQRIVAALEAADGGAFVARRLAEGAGRAAAGRAA